MSSPLAIDTYFQLIYRNHQGTVKEKNKSPPENGRLFAALYGKFFSWSVISLSVRYMLKKLKMIAARTMPSSPSMKPVLIIPRALRLLFLYSLTNPLPKRMAAIMMKTIATIKVVKSITPPFPD
jgi:hypothetical protein